MSLWKDYDTAMSVEVEKSKGLSQMTLSNVIVCSFFLWYAQSTPALPGMTQANLWAKYFVIPHQEIQNQCIWFMFDITSEKDEQTQ